MFLKTEPPYYHDQIAKIGILLVNIGTPEAPHKSAVRRYLKQFLSDPRVVELPRWLWQPILRGIILNTRPKQSARKYASIWSEHGSPLAYHTEQQAKLLQSYFLNQEEHHIIVEWAMCYGNPSIVDKITVLKLQGCDRLLVVPMYPQYASSSSGCVFNTTAAALMHVRNIPELRFIKHFHDHPDYINCIVASIREHWQQHGRAEHLLISFHGLPEYSLKHGDPYYCECHKTARLIAEQLSLTKSYYRVAFQSRFGSSQWLQPYSHEILAELGAQCLNSIDVICPGFVADCLETLEEIAIEGKRIFKLAGGKQFRYIPALNTHVDWIAALAHISKAHLSGWQADPSLNATENAQRLSLAKALGAKA